MANLDRWGARRLAVLPIVWTVLPIVLAVLPILLAVLPIVLAVLPIVLAVLPIVLAMLATDVTWFSPVAMHGSCMIQIEVGALIIRKLNFYFGHYRNMVLSSCCYKC